MSDLSPTNETYQHGHHASVVANHAKRTADTSAAFFLPFLKSGMRLLDVGCGPGSITTGLARRVEPAATIGIDPSPSVIETARSLAEAKGPRHLTFEVGTIYEPRFAPETFEAVFAHQVLQHLGRPVDALRQIRTLLTPGGMVGVRDVDWGSTTFYPENQGMRRFFTLYYELARRNGGALSATVVPRGRLCRSSRHNVDSVLHGRGRNTGVGRYVRRAHSPLQSGGQGLGVRDRDPFRIEGNRRRLARLGP